MLRVKDLPKAHIEGHKEVADFFGMQITEVSNEIQPNTFSINISNNLDAQEKFKTINPYGNGRRPGSYDFSQKILVMWTGSKVQPV